MSISCSVLGAASGFVGPILSAKENSKARDISTVSGATVKFVLNLYYWCLGSERFGSNI